MILSVTGLEKSFDDKLIFKNCSFNIEEKEKAAIVGVNGAGKSTLLKIIVGELSADRGDIFTAKNKTFGYLAQYQDISSDNTIYEEMLAAKAKLVEMENKIRLLEEQMKLLDGAELENLLTSYTNLTHSFELLGGYTYKSEISGVLKGLGFGEDMYEKHISKLSGGQKTRVALGKMLLSNPDIILLDEPTNHLDITSIAWLEGFLSSYNGTVIIVAHDRYFLDRIVTKVIEIDRTNVAVYMGNYSEYAKKRAAAREALMHKYLNQQREIKHQEEVIKKLRSFNREKSIKRAESREKMLNRMEVIEKPDDDANRAGMRLTLTPGIISGNDVLSVDCLAKSFGQLTLFKNISFEIKRGERVALIGENGSGKTTILKIINGLIEADSGSVTLGAKVHIGYYDQEHQLLDMDNTVFDEISDAYPSLTNTAIRNMLAAFLFTGDDVFKLVSDLSGGERGRLSLAKLMLSEANFLILDEPTNHLDMDSKEILENALNSYEGTVFFVSHDRYFINTTATRILDLENGLLVNYTGNYDYYLEKHEHLSQLAVENNQKDAVIKTTAPASANNDGKADWQTMKAKQAMERKRQNTLKKTEEEISEIEERLKLLDNEMLKEEVFTSAAKCIEISREQTALKELLDALYESWEELASCD